MTDHITLCRQLHEAMPELDAEFSLVENPLRKKEAVRIQTRVVRVANGGRIAPDFTSDDLWKVLPTKTRLEKFTIWGHPDKRRKLPDHDVWNAYLFTATRQPWFQADLPCCALKRLALELHKQGLLK